MKRRHWGGICYCLEISLCVTISLRIKSGRNLFFLMRCRRICMLRTHKLSCLNLVLQRCFDALWFLQDYFDIVKNPMDLSTIKRKLDTGQYQEPWQYVDDIWLMFNNAWLYNRKTSRVYKYCSKLAEVFEQEIDPVMQSLGYCCGRKVRKDWGFF